MKTKWKCKSPLGVVEIIFNEDCSAVTGLSIRGNKIAYDETEDKLEKPELVKETIKQVQKYFSGKLKEFTVPLEMNGTYFQCQVWSALLKIPYGETRSYGEIAKSIGNPKACRAVGMANNRNPIGIICPCHRVIGADGSLVGYDGGLDLKKYLLDLEKENS